MPVVVFDLDHTLIRCDSFARFNRHLLLRQCWRTALVLVASPIIVALLIARRTRVLAGSALVWCGTVGMNEAELHGLMELFVARHFGDVTELVCRGAVQALLAHQRDGARVLIATGAVRGLAERVCRNIGISNVEVVGSTLRPWFGGWVAQRHCYGRNKVQMLIEHGVGEQWDIAYTDSVADIPLLSRALRRYAVNPKPHHQRRLSALFGAALEIVEWR